MKNIWIFAALPVALCLGTSVAQAESRSSGFYLGGQYGYADLKDYSQDRLMHIPGAAFSQTSSQDTTVGWGRLFGGYRLNEIVALELGYGQLGNSNFRTTTTQPPFPSGSTRGTTRMEGLDLSAIISPFSSVRGLYFRAGVTEYTTQVQSTDYYDTDVLRSSSETFTGMGTTLGVGYDWKLGPGALRFEATMLQSLSDIRDNDAMTYSAGYLYQF